MTIKHLNNAISQKKKKTLAFAVFMCVDSVHALAL